MKNNKICCECGYDSIEIQLKPCPKCGKTFCEECYTENLHDCDIGLEWYEIEGFDDEEYLSTCPNCGDGMTEDEAYFSEYLDAWVCVDCLGEAERENESWMDYDDDDYYDDDDDDDDSF